MRRQRNRRRFEDEGVNPMNYISNLSDAMLVLAVGMMLALIVHWNVDIGSGTETGRTSEPTSQTQIDRDNAPSFTDDDLKETEQPSESGELEKLGEVYYDAATGKYYIIENSNGTEGGQ